jgi:hypothetical protein
MSTLPKLSSSVLFPRCYIFLVFLAIFLSAKILLVHGSPTNPIQAFPVFNEEEVEYHKYAAAIAASEPLRKLRDEELKSVLNPLTIFLERLKGIKHFYGSFLF